MKDIKFIVAMAVILLGYAFSAYAFIPSNMGVNMESGVLNINTATVEDLKVEPNIDNLTADNTVNYRESHGPFTSIDEPITNALNINTATAQELSMLPFVDSQTAQNIVSYRDTNGPFSAIDELKNVKGITRTMLIDLRSHLKLEGSSDYNPYAEL
jgi:competence ComEA-like helix-hairpin-helix protein